MVSERMGISRLNEDLFFLGMSCMLDEQAREEAIVDKYDMSSAIIQYEDGTIDDEGFIDLFQYLVDTGLAWSLQGHYGRTAAALIDDGYITLSYNDEVV